MLQKGEEKLINPEKEQGGVGICSLPDLSITHRYCLIKRERCMTRLFGLCSWWLLHVGFIYDSWLCVWVFYVCVNWSTVGIQLSAISLEGQ